MNWQMPIRFMICQLGLLKNKTIYYMFSVQNTLSGRPIAWSHFSIEGRIWRCFDTVSFHTHKYSSFRQLQNGVGLGIRFRSNILLQTWFVGKNLKNAVDCHLGQLSDHYYISTAISLQKWQKVKINLSQLSLVLFDFKSFILFCSFVLEILVIYLWVESPNFTFQDDKK